MILNCEKCGKKLRLGDEVAGKKVRCPLCTHVFRAEIPVAEEVQEAVVAKLPPREPPSREPDSDDELPPPWPPRSRGSRQGSPRRSSRPFRQTGSSLGMWLGLGAGAFLILGLGALAVFVLRDNRPVVRAPIPPPPAVIAQRGLNWQMLAPPQGHFQIELPGRPLEKLQVVQGLMGPVSSPVFELNLGVTWGYAVGYVDIPAQEIHLLTVEQRLQGAREGARAKINGILVREIPIEVDGHPGKEWEFNVPNRNSKVFGRIIAAPVADKLRLFILAVETLDKNRQDPDVARFFDSFKLVDVASPTAPQEVVDLFVKAVQQRDYKLAASYCQDWSPYKKSLTDGHELAGTLGRNIDEFSRLAQEKELLTDLSKDLLRFLDPFPHGHLGSTFARRTPDHYLVSYAWTWTGFKGLNSGAIMSSLDQRMGNWLGPVGNGGARKKFNGNNAWALDFDLSGRMSVAEYKPRQEFFVEKLKKLNEDVRSGAFADKLAVEKELIDVFKQGNFPKYAFEQFAESLAQRDLKRAAAWMRGPSAQDLIAAHDAAQALGKTLDELHMLAKQKSLHTPRTQLLLDGLEPFPRPQQRTMNGDSPARIEATIRRPGAALGQAELAWIAANLDRNMFSGAFSSSLNFVVSPEKGDPRTWKVQFLPGAYTPLKLFVARHPVYVASLEDLADAVRGGGILEPAIFENELKERLVLCKTAAVIPMPPLVKKDPETPKKETPPARFELTKESWQELKHDAGQFQVRLPRPWTSEKKFIATSAGPLTVNQWSSLTSKPDRKFTMVFLETRQPLRPLLRETLLAQLRELLDADARKTTKIGNITLQGKYTGRQWEAVAAGESLLGRFWEIPDGAKSRLYVLTLRGKELTEDSPELNEFFNSFQAKDGQPEQLTAYAPAKTAGEAIDFYIKAMGERNYKAAALYCEGEYAANLIKAHTAARLFGQVIEELKQQVTPNHDLEAVLDYFDPLLPKGLSDTKQGAAYRLSVRNRGLPPSLTRSPRLENFKVASILSPPSPFVKAQQVGDSWVLRFEMAVVPSIDYFLQNHARYVQAMVELSKDLRTRNFANLQEKNDHCLRVLAECNDDESLPLENPRQTPKDVCGLFVKALQERDYKKAAAFCVEGPYATALRDGHDAGRTMGCAVDDFAKLVNQRGLVTDLTRDLLLHLDPCPAASNSLTTSMLSGRFSHVYMGWTWHGFTRKEVPELRGTTEDRNSNWLFPGISGQAVLKKKDNDWNWVLSFSFSGKAPADQKDRQAYLIEQLAKLGDKVRSGALAGKNELEQELVAVVRQGNLAGYTFQQMAAALEKRDFRLAATFARGELARNLTEAHDAAQVLGKAVDQLQAQAKSKSLHTARTRALLNLVEPIAPDAQIGIGGVSEPNGFSLVSRDLLLAKEHMAWIKSSLDVRFFARASANIPAILFVVSPEKDQPRTWKVELYTTLGTLQLPHFVQKHEVYVAALNELTELVRTGRCATPADFEKELQDRCIKCK